MIINGRPIRNVIEICSSFVKFLSPKTLVGAFSPTLLINWLFGIGMAEYPMGRPRPIISAFSTIVNFALVAGSLWMANLLGLETFRGSRIAAQSYRVWNTYFCGTFFVASTCLAYIGAKIVRESRYKLNVMNERLKALGIPEDFEVVFKAQIVQISFLSIFMFSATVLNFKYAARHMTNELSRVSFVMMTHYLFIVACIVDGNFSTHIRYLSNRFHHLNTLLAGLELAVRNDVASTTQESGNEFQRYSSAINGIHRNNPLAIEDVKDQWPLHVIRETRKIHRGLCKVATGFNRAFGIQMLLSVALSFGKIVNVFYTAYLVATSSSSNRSIFTKWLWKVVAVMWTSSYAIKVFVVVEACETTSYEANRTGEVVSNLRVRAACDEDMRDEISIFSLQLIQNPISFTANGFFTLNYSLICEMIGSITTYMVIMIQMHTTYDLQSVDITPNSTML